MFPFLQSVRPVFSLGSSRTSTRGGTTLLRLRDSHLSVEAVKKLFDDLLCPPALSHYADPYPATDPTNNQLVPYVKDPVKATTTRENKDLYTHDGLFKNNQSSHRLSRDQDREARTSA